MVKGWQILLDSTFGYRSCVLSFPLCGNGLSKPLDSGLRRNDVKETLIEAILDSSRPRHPNLQTPVSIAILRPMQFQTATFDTHAFVKRLTAAGMPESRAEILAQGQADFYERPATKEPFDFTLKHDFEKFRAELKYELNAAEHRLTIKLGAIIIIGMTVLKAALA